MAGPQQQQAIIIRRKKVSGHGGHHGGAWKVAYADFVTAMMAFFLLLWLLNVTTSDQRAGLADYFAPVGIAQVTSGSGGVMGGLTISAPGHMMAESSPPSLDEETVPTVGKGEEGEEDVAGKSEEGGGLEEFLSPAEELKNKAEQMQREEERFNQAEEVLNKSIAESPELSQFADQLMVDRTPEGLRIQIIDRETYSMFPSGSSILYERARDLIRLVGRVISRLPNHISITGHTDSSPFATSSRRDNWTLSTERANISRQELIFAGVNDKRIERVVGMADRDPLIPEDPKASKNRRISIVLLRKSAENSAISAQSSSAMKAQKEKAAAAAPASVAPPRPAAPSIVPPKPAASQAAQPKR